MLSDIKSKPVPLALMFLFLSTLSTPARAGMTITLQINNAGTISNTTQSNGMNYTTILDDLKLQLEAILKISLPGNSTDTSTDSGGLSLWSWLIIGGGFLVLVIIIIALYVDERNRLDGYEKMIMSGEPPPPPAAGSKVISVTLVHSCPASLPAVAEI